VVLETKMRRILLVEPAYKNKYPPLGLMKLSTYHKLKGDYVCFIKGCDLRSSHEKWDRVYISTLFTFYWDITIKTINFYKGSVNLVKDIYVGGVMATLLGDDIEKETGATVIRGLLDKAGMLDKDDKFKIDELIPDYQILNEIEYNYNLKDSYLTHATRGCPNNCPFCAVNIIEPEFIHYLPIKKQIMGIDEVYGPKQNLILMDNNVLASKRFKRIINDIIELGFYKGAKLNGRLRFVDFNQGTDANYLTPDKMELLAKTAIKPLRIAFDHIEMKDVYISKVKLARDHGLIYLSNYVLYNYLDTPEDFYERLRINCELNEELGTQIYSFPMKYIPLNAKNRSHVGKHWNKKLLRGIQCILIATRGMVTTKLDFFEAAFGTSPEEFRLIAMMPEHYIINREKYKNNGAERWRRMFKLLTDNQRGELIEAISSRNKILEMLTKSRSKKIKSILIHYYENEN